MKMPVTEEHGLRPLNLYGVTKVAGEKIMNSFHDNYGIETVNLRFGNIYGVGIFTRYDTVIPKFVKQALTGNELTIYGDGEYTRDFIHVEDITKAIMLGLSLKGIGGEVFNVGGETMSVNEIAKIVKEEIWRSRKIKVKSISTPPRKGETKKFSYNLTKIQEKMGFRNSWKVRSGVKQLFDYSIKYYD
jgi:UDP-glucose 4-epimerase